MNYLWYENNEENQLTEKTFQELKNKVKAAFNELIKSRQIEIDDNHPEDSAAESLEVVKYLREFGLKKLCKDNKVDGKRHPEYPNLIQFYYQVYAETSEIVRECRGIILDESRNWSVVAYPFNSFQVGGKNDNRNS